MNNKEQFSVQLEQGIDKNKMRNIYINYTNHFLQRFVERQYNLSEYDAEQYVRKNRSNVAILLNNLLAGMKLMYTGYSTFNKKSIANYYIKDNWLIIASQNIDRNGFLISDGITLFQMNEQQKRYRNELIMLNKKKRNYKKDTTKIIKIEKEMANCLNSIAYYGQIEKVKHINMINNALDCFKNENNTEPESIHIAEDNQEGISQLETQLAQLGINEKCKDIPMINIRTMDTATTWLYPKAKARKYCRA